MSTEPLHDFIVVGSGPSGAMAAQTLVERGARVLMLDVGIRDDHYRALVPDADFVALRREDPDQHRYLLGDDYEAVFVTSKRTGSQITPPRKFIFDRLDELLPYASDTFLPMESLAYGGLGSGWGAGCYVFSDAELAAAGLSSTGMPEAYGVVGRRIGVSAGDDDARPYCAGTLDGVVQPPSRLDRAMRQLRARYAAKRGVLNRDGFFLGQPMLALLTRDLDGRRAMRYQDMDFFTDRDRSAYRPWMTIEALKQHDGFAYRDRCMVLSFEDGADAVTVAARDTETGEALRFRCRRLVLACGVLGTARVVMRAFGYARTQLPVLCNPYSYMPLVQWRMLGRTFERHKSGFAQLVLFHDARGDGADVAMASLYTYRSLLLYKLIAESPLNYRDSRVLMQYLQSSFVIAGVHQPEGPGPDKYVALRREKGSFTGDVLTGRYVLSAEETAQVRARERAYGRAFRALGCLPVKTIRPAAGASIHYGGSLPFSEDAAPYRLHPSGRLHGTGRVYVADGSGFRFLPAKGVTFTLMANAHLVAEHASTDAAA